MSPPRPSGPPRRPTAPPSGPSDAGGHADAVSEPASNVGAVGEIGAGLRAPARPTGPAGWVPRGRADASPLETSSEAPAPPGATAASGGPRPLSRRPPPRSSRPSLVRVGSRSGTAAGASAPDASAAPTPRQATALHPLAGLRADALRDGTLSRRLSPLDADLDPWAIRAGPGLGWEETAGTPVALADVFDAALPVAPAVPSAPDAGLERRGEATAVAEAPWDAAGRVQTSRQQIGLLLAGVAFAFVAVVAGTAYLAWTPPAPPPAPVAPAVARPAVAPSTAAVASAVPAGASTAGGADDAAVSPPAATAGGSAPAPAAPPPGTTSPASTAPTERGLGWPAGSSFGAPAAPSSPEAGPSATDVAPSDAASRVGALSAAGSLHVRLEDGFGGGRLVFKCLTGSASHVLRGAAVDVPGLAEGCSARAACEGGQVVATTIAPGTTRAVCGGCTPEQPQPRCRPE
jgi:hypothetical protein